MRAVYKHTEVGVIPEDWGVSRLSTCLLGKAEYGINAPSVPFSESLPQYIRITDISPDGRFDPAPAVSVKSDGDGKYLVKDGDVLLARTGASVGKSYRYRREDGPLVFAGFLIRVSPDPQKLDSVFLHSLLQTGRYWSWVRQNSLRSGQPGINGIEYGGFLLPLPCLAEQRAIAEALGDVDAAVEGLERLIAKKRDLKQAAMQQLLTGQTRLPGFSGEWEEKRLGDVVETDPASLSAQTKPNFSFNYIALEDVDRGRLLGWSEQQFRTAPSRAKRILQQGDILVSTVRPSLQAHLLFSLEESQHPWVCSTGFCVVRCKVGISNPAFIFALLFSPAIERQIVTLTAGSNYPAINSGDVRGLIIRLPNYHEQSAIAIVLSDMDAELAALQAQLDKTRLIKQAMMQDLLTGRVRLPY